MHTVVLARDVRRSRELAVSAREEERRRLYRDLHDGLGPALAGALKVEAARDLWTTPTAADELLDQVRGAHRRHRGGRPQLVVTDSVPRRWTTSAWSTPSRAARRSLPAAPCPRHVGRRAGRAVSELPAAVEVAVYPDHREALTNVARHARAHAALVRLEREAGGWSCTVTDDGAASRLTLARGWDSSGCVAGRRNSAAPSRWRHGAPTSPGRTGGAGNRRHRAAAAGGPVTFRRCSSWTTTRCTARAL